MSWRYRQSTGELSCACCGRVVAVGYSGHGEGRNNPAMEASAGVGPIPAGQWSIGPMRDSPSLGPVVMDLVPVGHDAHGRSLFRIHGDNAAHDASHGCIVLPRPARALIGASPERTLEVVP